MGDYIRFPPVDAVFASVVMLTDNFHSYNEAVETISQVYPGEGGSSDDMDRRRRVETSEHLFVFKTAVGNFFKWFEFLLFLMLGTMKIL